MKFPAKLACVAAGAAAALSLPLTALAADSFSFTISPTTHGANSTTSSSLTVAKIPKAIETILPVDEKICHHGDACAPADNTVVGSTSVTGVWIFSFCSSGTQTFNATWVALDGSYTPPSGFTVVAQVNNVNSLATVKSFVIFNSSTNEYRIEIPSIPTLTCSGHNTTLASTLGTFSGHTYNLNTNPSTVGSWTVTDKITFTDNSTEQLTAGYSTT